MYIIINSICTPYLNNFFFYHPSYIKNENDAKNVLLNNLQFTKSLLVVSNIYSVILRALNASRISIHQLIYDKYQYNIAMIFIYFFWFIYVSTNTFQQKNDTSAHYVLRICVVSLNVKIKYENRILKKNSN